jgi:hypothetical protein
MESEDPLIDALNLLSYVFKSHYVSSVCSQFFNVIIKNEFREKLFNNERVKFHIQHASSGSSALCLFVWNGIKFPFYTVALLCFDAALTDMMNELKSSYLLKSFFDICKSILIRIICHVSLFLPYSAFVGLGSFNICWLPSSSFSTNIESVHFWD